MDKGMFVCQVCQGQVVMITSFSGSEDEMLGVETGEAMEVIASERDLIHEIRYECSQRCGWWVGEKEWEEIYGE